MVVGKARFWGLVAIVLTLGLLATAPASAALTASDASSKDYLRVGRSYQPTLYVDHDDRFWPASFLNVLSLTWDGRYTCLNRKAKKLCGRSGRPLSVRLLRPGRGAKSDFLDYPAGRGDIDDQAKSFAQNVGSPSNSRAYFFAGSGRGKTRTIASFQYWYFYNFNYVASSVAFRGYHEGDLEHVAILFRAGKVSRRTRHGVVRRKVPKYVYLSQHNGGELLKWKGGGLKRDGLSPIVHAARGTHANYKDCGEHGRGVLPRDFSECDRDKLFNFRRARLIPVQPKSWACWRGRLGRGGNLPRYGASPRPILQQQGFYTRTPSNLCSRYVHAGSAGAATAAAGAGVQQAAELFDDCGDWQRPPTRPGSMVVACDQALLKRFFRSGLSDPGRVRLRVHAPGQATDYDPPAVMKSSRPGLLSRAAIVADRPVSPDVYAARRGKDGTLAEARFPDVPIVPGEETRVDTTGSSWRLVDSRGKVLGQQRPRVDRTLTPPQPLRLSVRRSGQRALVSWRTNGDPTRRTRFFVTGAATSRGLGRSPRILGRVVRSDTGIHSIVVVPGRARWLSVLAYRDGRELRGGRVPIR